MERPAKFSHRGGKVHAKADHDLCAECWRALRNRAQAADRRPPLSVFLHVGATRWELNLPATMPWHDQNRRIRAAVDQARAEQTKQAEGAA